MPTQDNESVAEEVSESKENLKPVTGPAFSKASKSTTAMSIYKGGYDAGSMKSNNQFHSFTNAEDGIFNMRNVDSALDNSIKKQTKLNTNNS